METTIMGLYRDYRVYFGVRAVLKIVGPFWL